MYFGNLSEELLLMVLDSKTGKIKRKNYQLVQGLIGGFLLELILQGRLAIYKNKIIVLDETDTGDEILDIIFERINLETETLSIHSWLRVLRLQFGNIEEMMLENLVKKEVVRKESQVSLVFFKSDRYFLVKSNMKDLIISNIQRVVIDNEESDHRTLAILSLMYAINSEDEIFNEEELENYLYVIRNLVSSDEIGQSITMAINNTAEALMRSLILTTTY